MTSFSNSFVRFLKGVIKFFPFFLLSACFGKEIPELMFHDTKKEKPIVWELQELDGKPLLGPTIQFSKKRFGAFGGCNQGSGDFRITEKNISFKQFIRTEKACMGNGILENEYPFFGALARVVEWKLESPERLILFGENTKLVFSKKPPKQDKPLEKTLWKVNAIFLEGMVSSLFRDSEISFTLENGMIKGFSGCGNFIGKYTSHETTITFFEITSKIEKCKDTNIENQEKDFLGKLQQIDSFQLKEDNLELHSKNKPLFHCKGM